MNFFLSIIVSKIAKISVSVPSIPEACPWTNWYCLSAAAPATTETAAAAYYLQPMRLKDFEVLLFFSYQYDGSFIILCAGMIVQLPVAAMLRIISESHEK